MIRHGCSASGATIDAQAGKTIVICAISAERPTNGNVIHNRAATVKTYNASADCWSKDNFGAGLPPSPALAPHDVVRYLYGHQKVTAAGPIH
jgi:hypothetical protein